MKRLTLITCASLVLVLVTSLAGHAARFRGGIWIGPGWWAPYPYPYPYYAAPPVIIQQQPDIYVQPAPQPPPQPEPEPAYWYYCQNPQGYYPYVKQCPSGWMKVVPRPAPPDRKE